MKISNNNGDWRKNVYGKVRTNGTKAHHGIDLAGIPGEAPVYSMFSGTVIKVVYGQPNRINGELPQSYTGADRDGGGNRITIQSIVDGQKVSVTYMHLDTKENNEYTQTLKAGDSINAGQIIGIVGYTGNADKNTAHLHLETMVVYVNKKLNEVNELNNPERFLYTEFDINRGANGVNGIIKDGTGITTKDCDK